MSKTEEKQEYKTKVFILYTGGTIGMAPEEIMEVFIQPIFVIYIAARDITGHGLRNVVVVQPLHVTPGSFSPDEIVYPE